MHWLNEKNMIDLCRQGGSCFTLRHFVYESLLSTGLIQNHLFEGMQWVYLFAIVYLWWAYRIKSWVVEERRL